MPGSLFGFCNQDTPLGVLECPQNSGGHKEITEIALGFLRPGILEDIIDEHLFVDITGVLDATKHFDNSEFTATIARINNQYSGGGGVVAGLDPDSTNPFDVTDEFGTGGGSVNLMEGDWPKEIIVRIHLRGLEGFSVKAGEKILLAQRDLKVRLLDNKGEPLPGRYLPTGPDVPKKIPGYFEVQLPLAKLKGTKQIDLSWVDFYRR